MGESRQELLAWVNGLLQLNITKVEQCGTGAAYCQIFDSIFLDVPMARVKFNVNTEYAYIQNFKILQNVFTRHQLERTVPVEALIKCKMQDNLDFLQYTKRYWDQYFPGHEYDAVARRKGAPTSTPSAAAPRASTGAGARKPAGASGGVKPRVGSAAGGAVGGGASSAALARLKEENAVMQDTVVGLEKERDFYFSKLRDIELLVQQAFEADPELDKEEDSLMKHIQAILYSTEEGFEIPEDQQGELQGDEAETF